MADGRLYTKTDILSGSVAISGGTKTPISPVNTPTDCLDVWAFPSMYDATSGRWVFLSGTDTKGLWVTGTEAAVSGTATPGNAVNVAAREMGWDSGAGVWRFALTDSTGRRLVVGDKSPSDADANPTDCVDTRSFMMGWDNSVSQWKRLIISNQRLLVANQSSTFSNNDGTAGNAYNNANSFNAVIAAVMLRNKQSATTNSSINATADNRGAQFVRKGAPDPTASTVSDYALTSAVPTSGTNTFGAAVKASAAALVQLRANNVSATGMYAVVVNKATGAVNGDVTVWAVWVPPSSTATETFDLPIRCGTGLTWAWSTDADSVQLVPGATVAKSSIILSYQ